MAVEIMDGRMDPGATRAGEGGGGGRMRRRGGVGLGSLDGLGVGPEMGLGVTDLRRRRSRAFADEVVARSDALTPGDGALLRLVFADGKSLKEIAELLGCTPGKVRRGVSGSGGRGGVGVPGGREDVPGGGGDGARSDFQARDRGACAGGEPGAGVADARAPAWVVRAG
ncbi:MAG: sigma-70 region 4 domain-containing protein [Phycisphaeraceae bacterium]|nr:MAG: sigma-70 region 4 domain-containing protein [Phycisphaeraceae bacterium]